MKTLFVLFILLYSCNVFAQCNDRWRAGSAYSLKGKTYILTVFISEKEWDKKEKLELYTQITEAQNWLVKQANNYGKTISFEGGNFGLDKTLIIDNIPVGSGSGKEPVDLTSVVLKKIGYSSNLQFVEWVKKNTSCTNSLVLIIANKVGRGYALPYSTEMNKEKYFLEGCILYKEYSPKSSLASSSIAHEVLHLFGAWDLYTTFAQTKDREEKARKVYPDDIMLRTSYNINDLKIDKLTAWLVGLNSTEEKSFEWFREKGHKK